MKTLRTLSLSSLLLATALTSNALADEIEGRVSTTLDDQLLIKSGAVTFVVKDADDMSYLRAFDRSRRKVKVDGDVGKPVVDETLGAVRPLTNVKVLDKVDSVSLKGTLSHRYDGATILNTAQGPYELTRVPMELIAPLTGKEVNITGLLFTGRKIPQVALTGMQDKVSKKGYLTQRRKNPTTGKMEYKGVGNVEPGTPITVIGLEGWNIEEKTSAHAADMDADDMLFAYVRTADGNHGFIPAYKLELGSVVDNALRPFKRATEQSRADQQQKAMEEAATKAAKKARQAEVVVTQGQKKKGAIGGLEDAQQTPAPELREQRQLPADMGDMEQKQVKLD